MPNQRTVHIKAVLKNILASVCTNYIGEETERRPFMTLSTRTDEAQDGNRGSGSRGHKGVEVTKEKEYQAQCLSGCSQRRRKAGKREMEK